MIESQLAAYCIDLMRQNLNPSTLQYLTFSPLRSSYAALPSSATSFLSPRLSSTTSSLTTVLYLSSALWIDGKYCKLYNLADRRIHVHIDHVINISFLVLYKFDILSCRFHVAMCLCSNRIRSQKTSICGKISLSDTLTTWLMCYFFVQTFHILIHL